MHFGSNFEKHFPKWDLIVFISKKIINILQNKIIKCILKVKYVFLYSVEQMFTYGNMEGLSSWGCCEKIDSDPDKI